MLIKFHSDIAGSFLDVAKVVVDKFVRENPGILSHNDIEMRVNLLAARLNPDQKETEMKNLDIKISYEVLPEDMKTWALAKEIIEIQASDLDGVTSRIQEVKLPTYTFSNRDWSDVQLVQLAKEGQRGAWFFANAKRGSVVVKGQEEADKQLIGTVFLQSMNMKAPDARLVERFSSEGTQLSTLGEPHGLNTRNPTHYIVMDRVKGPTYSNLSSSTDDIQLVVNNLENLGELAIYDLILGNFDRFQLDTMGFNSGNIMFEDGVLHPIDTDCIFSEERFAFTKLVLRKMIEGRGEYDDKIARKLREHLGDGIRSELIPNEKIKVGMNNAIAKLIGFTQNMDMQKQLFLDRCRERGGQLNHFPNHVEKLLLYIKSVSASLKF